MAAFNIHLAGGILTGAAMSWAGYDAFGLNIPQTTSVFIMGALGALLPDLDHDTGKPLALLFSVVSVLIPALLLDRVLPHAGLSLELLVSYFTLCYLVINYLICAIIKKITIHRGAMHSIPFAILFGLGAYFLFLPSGKQMAMVSGAAVLLGSFTHLLLDEFHSFTFRYGCIPTLKRSAGTALKLTTGNHFISLVTYGLIGGLGYGAMYGFGF